MSALFGRILLKLSGEALAADGGFGISPKVIRALAELPRISQNNLDKLAVVLEGQETSSS